MSTDDVPTKPRRKKLDVPVHNSTDNRHKHTKTFSANFNAKSYKNRFHDEQYHTDIVVEIPESDGSIRPTKKQLKKENLLLIAQNKELLGKFHELENLSVRKITKLREKICLLQDANAEIKEQNANLTLQCENLLKCCQDMTKQLELSQICDNCEQLKVTIENYAADNKLLKTSNKDLNGDLNMLKTVLFRLNVQLERYQECLRKNNIKMPVNSPLETNKEMLEGAGESISKEVLSEVHRSHRHTPISWGSVHSHTLGPLLDAYEDRLQEKEEIIQNYEMELCNFTGKLKEIIMENEDLYNKLTEDEGCSSKLKVELDKLKTELKTTREQNDVLIKKCALKQDKLEEVLKVYETKVSQMKRDFDVLHSEYIRYKTENAALKEKNKCFLDSQEELKDQMQKYIPITVHTASVNECKKWYEELKLQYEKEKKKLIENIENQAKTIGDLNNQISNITKTRQTYEDKILQLEKHIKKTETKYLELEHVLNQVQLSRSALRKQLHKAMSFAKDMVAEQETLLKALNQRQLENKAVRKIGSDMATRMDSLKNQLKDVQKTAWQEFTTVEQTIHQQAELIDTMKEEHQKEIEKLRKVIQEREESNILLKNENLPMPHYLLFRDKYQ